MKTRETHLKLAILGGDAHSLNFFKVPVWLFHFFSGSFQAVYNKKMYSSPTISYFFLYELFLLALNECCLY